MDENDLMALIQSLPPEQLQSMIDAVTAQDRGALAGQRVQRGNELMDTQQPQPMRVGNTMVARSPLENVAAALRQGYGTSQMLKQGGVQDQAIGQKGQGLLAYLRGVAGQGQQGGAQEMPPGGWPVQNSPTGNYGY